jgi:signal transduction histidine kinase/tetratricopeptide (TPR) repeat protein
MMSNETVIASLKEKIDDLNQQAWEARVNDSPKAFELSSESVKLSREINYPKGLAEGLRSLGFCYVRLFKNDEAEPLLRESLSLFQSLNDLRGQAVIYEYLGIIERNWGNLGHSLELLLKGNELVRQVGPPDVEVTCCYQIGVTYKHLGNHENALDYLYRSLSLAEKIDLTLMVAYSTNIIGSIYFDNGNYEKALELYQQGLIIRRQSKDKWGEAGSLDNIGITYLKLNQLDKAIEYCKQSLAISQSTGDKKGEANALLHLAEIYEKANDIQQSAKFSNESLEIRKARGDKRGEAEVLLFLAELHKNRNDVSDHQIYEWINGALNIANEIKSQDILSKACFNLHEYHQRNGNYKESLAQLEAYLQIEKELHKNAINQKVSNLEISHKAEAISQQNKELTELNEQIEKANAELKVESSLERVRTTAMAMKEPDDMLEICKVITHELSLLNVKEIRNIQTAIFYEKKGSYMNYEYYAKHDKTFITDVDYNNHEVAKKFATQMLKGPNQVWTHGFKGEEVKDWLKYQRTTNVFIDNYLETAHSLNYYWYSLGPVALGISTYSPLSEEQVDLFKRFRNVFELAYRRYLDIEKAQAQAREAQIEAALEKVRSRSLAVHKSDEFNEVIKVVFEMLQELEIPMTSVSLNIAIDDSKDTDAYICGFGEKGLALSHIRLIYFDHPIANDRYDAYKKGLDFFTKTYSAEEKNSFFEYQFEVSELKNIPPDIKKKVMDSKLYTCSVGFSKNSMIVVNDFEGKSLSPKEIDIVKRFSKVFEQAYTRFLDLQKAEAQSREAQIQLALERVRARTMAMQHSNELQDAAILLFEQIKTLGIPTGSCAFNIWNNNEASTTVWSSSVEGKLQDPFQLPHTESPIYKDVYTSAKNGDTILIKEVEGTELKKHFDYLTTVPGIDHVINKLRESGYVFPEKIVYHFAFFNQGYLSFHLHEFYPEAKEIFVRFAKVFEQTYTRFLDLQKAEAQAREAQIETALERVRSRSMAMQKSDELKEVIQLVYEQFVQLKINVEHTGFIMDYKSRNDLHIWLADQHLVPSEVTIPWFDSPPNNSIKEAKEMGQDFFEYLLTFEEKNKFYRDLFKLIPDVPEETLEYYLTCPGLAGSGVLLENIGLYIENFSGTPYTDQENAILMRFGKVFQQTYTRFLDLQKAEAQAREAKIEAALERTRTQSMIMQHSNELDDTLRVFHEQVLLLGINSAFSFLWLPDEDKDRHIFWATWAEKENGSTVFKSKAINYPLDRNEPATAQCLIDWKGNEPVVSYHVPPTGVESYFAVWSELIAGVERLKPGYFSNGLYYVEAFMKYGCFGVMVEKELLEEEKKILLRFAIEFERTYTRFLDLQKAEAQSREAQIELGLERVRARAMAMQKSGELAELVDTVFKELTKLHFTLDRCIIIIIDEKSESANYWMANPESKTPTSYHLKMEGIPYLDFIFNSWKERKTKIVYDLKGDEKTASVKYIFSKTELKHLPDLVKEGMKNTDRIFLNSSFNNFGGLQADTIEPISEDNLDIIYRFAKVFDLTYTRFNDLQKAEAQTREATIEVALERVRARALAMQEPEELKDVAQVLRNEMGALGIEELETCSIYIHEKDSETAECWYALKDPKNEEKKMVTDHFQLTLNDTWVGREMKKFYNSDDKQTSIVMQGINRKEWIDYCYKNSPVFSGFYGETIPDRTYHLYKFSHGYIGAAAPGDISNESWKLLSRAASVFSLAYSRFRDLTQARNDLVKLKEEKKRAEDALTELQATQKQLIQTEKMASLGELTAGIAHEIQNPLNFVNNFSDVSNELIEEMKHELESGNTKDAMEIADSVKDNLEKILHHGKRADAIVKGMLQHSRSSSGVKEPTDINNLADEYLRLAFHGYRAKDKSFNAKFETNFDNTVEKINVIPQDIGRVILNLINNAFYTVNEKRKQVSNGYEPTVIVSTKKVNDKVEISVKDNGNGIPQKMLDKIFQPFFTTKPTGQGTGLGLSLSYDIITKGHAGEIEVKTDEGKGAEFIISLPVN